MVVDMKLLTRRKTLLAAAALIASPAIVRAGWLPLVGAAAGNPTVTWNPADKAPNILLSNGNLTATGQTDTSGTWNSVRATLSQSAGKRYFENTYVSGGGCVLGVASAGGTLAGHYVGSLGASGSIGEYTGSLQLREGYVTTSFSAISAYPTGSVLGFVLDLDTGKGFVSLNNDFTFGGKFTSSNPVTEANPAFVFTANSTLFPATSSAYLSSAFTVTTLAASGTFAYSPPSGVIAWNA